MIPVVKLLSPAASGTSHAEALMADEVDVDGTDYVLLVKGAPDVLLAR